MRATRERVAVLCLVAALAAAPALAQDRDAGGRVPTVTRLVKLFLEREAALGDAIRAGDAAAIEGLLTDDFELRVGARADSPVPRAAFVQELARTRDGGGEPGRMAVHDLGSAAIASFVQARPGGSLFVVDVWQRVGTDWKLAIRYAGPAGGAAAIPGAGPAAAPIPKKY